MKCPGVIQSNTMSLLWDTTAWPVTMLLPSGKQQPSNTAIHTYRLPTFDRPKTQRLVLIEMLAPSSICTDKKQQQHHMAPRSHFIHQNFYVSSLKNTCTKRAPDAVILQLWDEAVGHSAAYFVMFVVSDEGANLTLRIADAHCSERKKKFIISWFIIQGRDTPRTLEKWSPARISRRNRRMSIFLAPFQCWTSIHKIPPESKHEPSRISNRCEIVKTSQPCFVEYYFCAFDQKWLAASNSIVDRLPHVFYLFFFYPLRTIFGFFPRQCQEHGIETTKFVVRIWVLLCHTYQQFYAACFMVNALDQIPLCSPFYLPICTFTERTHTEFLEGRGRRTSVYIRW